MSDEFTKLFDGVKLLPDPHASIKPKETLTGADFRGFPIMEPVKNDTTAEVELLGLDYELIEGGHDLEMIRQQLDFHSLEKLANHGFIKKKPWRDVYDVIKICYAPGNIDWALTKGLSTKYLVENGFLVVKSNS